MDEGNAMIGMVLAAIAFVIAFANGLYSLGQKLGKGSSDKLAELERRINSHAASLKTLEQEAARMVGARVEERLGAVEKEVREMDDELRNYAHDLDLGVERLQNLLSMIEQLRASLLTRNTRDRS